MKIFTDKIGHPTIVLTFLVITIFFISISGSFNYYKTVGGGHSYIRLKESGMSGTIVTEEAKIDGLVSGIFMILGLNIPVTILFLIAIGLISKTIDTIFKRTLRILYIIVVGVGIIFLSLGIPFYQDVNTLIATGTSLLLYLIISVILWITIGISTLIKKKS
jgi:hypothetical protein